jgi:hypothetical protein
MLRSTNLRGSAQSRARSSRLRTEPNATEPRATLRSFGRVFRHSREAGSPVRTRLDPRFRGGDGTLNFVGLLVVPDKHGGSLIRQRKAHAFGGTNLPHLQALSR